MEPTLKVLSPENFGWRMPTGLAPRQATTRVALWRAARTLPGVLGRVEPDIESTW